MSWHPDDSYDPAMLQREEQAEVLDRSQVLARLRAAVDQAGSMAAFGRVHGLNKGVISDALAGKRPPTPGILRALGVERAYVGGRP